MTSQASAAVAQNPGKFRSQMAKELYAEQGDLINIPIMLTQQPLWAI